MQRDGTLRLALFLVFPTIGLEQLLHSSDQALLALPLYAALHWLSDSLLALPLAVLAVWGGQRLATRLRLGTATLADLVARASVIAVLFALTLVPGAAIHDVADRLTHAHTTLSIHSHVPVAALHATPTWGVDEAALQLTPTWGVGEAALMNFLLHGLGDGFAGQAIGLPLMVLAMWAHARGVRLVRRQEG
jgi:hypothetical protein